jgi:hypothetical protein
MLGGPLAAHPEIAEEVQRLLLAMREKGAIVNMMVCTLVMRAVIRQQQPEVLRELTLSRGWICGWMRANGWSWRRKTTAASKLPLDWRMRGVEVAKRIAFFMQVYKVSTVRNTY